MKKSLYRVEESTLLRDQFNVWKGDTILAKNLDHDEAQAVLAGLIERVRAKAQALHLEVQTQEGIANSPENTFTDAQRLTAKLKIKDLMSQWQNLLIELGEL